MTTQNKIVLVLTNSSDDHTHIIVPVIKRQGGVVYRIDVDRLPQFFDVSISNIGRDTSVKFTTPVGEISLDQICSIWVRRPYILDFNQVTPQEKLTRQEINMFMSSIPEITEPKILVVDKPSLINRASKKILQLKVAKTLGFKIPETFVTNSEKGARQFIKKYKNEVIIKVIDKGISMAGRKSLFIYTTNYSDQLNLKLIKNCPTLFQELIVKKSDIRVTVIGKKLFSVEFNTSKLAGVGVDWRKAGENIKKVPHQVIQLPTGLEKKILALLEYYGLNFGAIDMARTQDDEYVFFELNPAGQFLWLQEVTGLPLAKEMAKFLLGIS